LHHVCARSQRVAASGPPEPQIELGELIDVFRTE
jgi:hypothetical protein